MHNGMYDTPLLATFPPEVGQYPTYRHLSTRRRPAGQRGYSPSTSRPHRSEVGAEGLGARAGLSDALVHEQADKVSEGRRNRGNRDGEHHTEGVGLEHHNRGEHRVSHAKRQCTYDASDRRLKTAVFRGEP